LRAEEGRWRLGVTLTCGPQLAATVRKRKRGEGDAGPQTGRWAARLKEKAIGLLERCGLEEGRKVEVGRAVSWVAR
jgi:hypothetical protein